MATNFSANQYENAFGGQRLQNWEIPATFKERPSRLEGYTEPIADDRGHLLSGVKRSQKCPWGGFVGTWDSKEKRKPKLPSSRERVECKGGAEILTVDTPPPQSASKRSIEKPSSPVSQPFDEKNIGISKHIDNVKNIEAQESNKLTSPSPPPRTAERATSPQERKDDAESITVQPE